MQYSTSLSKKEYSGSAVVGNVVYLYSSHCKKLYL